MNNIKTIYIHIPFCKKICSYCDFCKMYYNSNWINQYLDALANEIKTNYKNETIKTLYIGGGTPSCLSLTELDKLFKILKIIKLNKKYEFTFECNIEDINEDLLKKLKTNKVNRLSIGIQTFNKKHLQLMNRAYIKDIKERIDLSKKYFNNINIDLIYGLENQTMEELQDDLNKFLELDLPHISIYSLILEEHTILNTNNYCELNSDIQRDMYDSIRKVLRNNNYIQYEISNFSKKGYESKHNLTYWNNEKYYGFGLGASGYVNNIRYTNTRNLNKYLNSNYINQKEVITKKIDMQNEMILGLRKIKGVSKKRFYKKYNININDVFNTSKLKENINCFYIQKNDLYVSNNILVDFI